MSDRPKKIDRGVPADRTAQVLRSLPPTDECLATLQHDSAMAGFGRDYLRGVIRAAQDSLRVAIKAGDSLSQRSREAMIDEVIRRAREMIDADRPMLASVVNATGVILHTNLGRALLAEAAIAAIERAARSAVNLEYDLASGVRGDRDAIVERELRSLTGAEAATVVNNNAAAVLLTLNTLAEGREVLVSRGELIEIGGSFRLPDVMVRSGARLREVGTTNRTHARDYTAGISPETALLLKVHPSNYRIVGFTAEVSLAELVMVGRANNLPVIEDLGAGALVDMGIYGLPREPVVRESIAAGADIVTFSGDKLLGGPQAGIIVGARALVEKLKANPLQRALRCDKLTLAALEATLRLYARSSDIAAELPTLRLMRRATAELEVVAARARSILADRLGAEFKIEIIDATSQIGSGALPTEELKTRALRVTHHKMSPDAVAAMFRQARPPVIGRIREGAFHLDVRTVEDASDFAVHFPQRN